MDRASVTAALRGQQAITAALEETAEAVERAADAYEQMARRVEASHRRISKFEESQKTTGGFQERLSSFVASSRFSAGGFQPLMGRANAALGLNAGNPAMMAAQFVLDAGRKVAEALVNVAEDAAAAGRKFSEIRAVTGADTGEAARLRAYGIDPQSTRALQDRITSDPFAQMFAQRVGVTPVKGPFGTLDTARTTLDLVKGLRTLEGEEQIRAIRALGAEHLAPLLRVSQRTLNRLEKDAELSARFYSREMEARTAEYDVAKQRFAASSEDFSAVVGQRPMEFMTRYLNVQTELIKVFTEATDDFLDMQDRAMKFFEPIIYPFGNPWEGLGAGDGAGAAMGENSAELKANTQALSRLTKTIGGGERSAAALPSALNGPQNRGDAMLRAYESGALRLGVL